MVSSQPESRVKRTADPRIARLQVEKLLSTCSLRDHTFELTDPARHPSPFKFAKPLLLSFLPSKMELFSKSSSWRSGMGSLPTQRRSTTRR
jgi:hypothetical protein